MSKRNHFLINRRVALVSLGVAALSGVARAISRPLRLLQSSSAPAKTTLDDLLREDLARLAPRAYSEEGIPVFLACENLVADKTSRAPGKVALTPTNTALASAVHRNAEAWQRIRPDAQGKDVAQLIEVLADRDFTRGGTAEEQ